MQLHHHTYVRLGKEELSDVTPLCRPHHEAVHEWLKTSGRKFVEYTHEAVTALGGSYPTPVRRRMTAAEGRALGLRKRDEARARKKARKEERRGVASGAPSGELVSAENCAADIRPVLAEFAAIRLTPNQIIRVNDYATHGELKQLVGFLKCLRDAEAKRAAPKLTRAQKKKLRKEKQKAGAAKTKPGAGRKTPPLSVGRERQKWADPLYAIRMLASGHRPPPK